MDTNLLEYVGPVVIPARADKFVAKNHFVINTDPNAAVNIVYLSPAFKEYFLEGDGKVEDVCDEQTLRCERPKRSVTSVEVVTALGGEEGSETTLYAALSVMEQRGAKNESLLFLVRDSAGVLRSVSVYWRGAGWLVGAHPVEGPCGWDGGYRVFSPNS